MTRTVPVLLAVCVLLVALPGVAAAETRSGGTVVVGPDETIEGDLEAFAGSVVVRGTVQGNLETSAGDVRIAESGTVEGDVEGAAGSVVIAGTVGGDVAVGAGSLRVTDTADIGGALRAGAGSIFVDGSVGGDAELGAETITLGSNAAVGGDLTYDGDLVREEGSSVAGTVTRDESLDVGVEGPLGDLPLAGPVFSVYGFVVTLLLGAVLLLAFPRFSTDLAARVADNPVRTGGVGLLAAIAIPVVLVLLLLTIVGIPLSLAGLLLFGLLAWAGSVYGRYAVGEWLLSYTGVENRWVALVVGALAVALLALVPVLGGLVELVVFLLGFGALVLGLRRRYGARDRRGGRPAPGAEPA